MDIPKIDSLLNPNKAQVSITTWALFCEQTPHILVPNTPPPLKTEFTGVIKMLKNRNNMKNILTLLFIALISLSASAQTSFFDFKAKNIDGELIDFKSFKGKKIMVVNVASKCGLTPQYEKLQALYEKYKSKGFIIVAFPANNFLSQEPGTNSEIKQFCTEKYNVTFPVMSKISVKGDDMDPIYQWLTQKAKNGYEDSDVKWNFQKYLISPDGKLVKVISPRTAPDDPEIIKWIEE